ncbi:MAG: cation:proton antiporter [Prevotellaceae bacterium]|jgi:Kef-type K+ transport system membrane component KefB|nr:cation:proton antiporter [Prevotellaceae bacterium]
MQFLAALSLPITDPVLKFLIILVIILLAPLLLNRIKVPALIGLILAGAIVGPNGFNIMLRDSGIIMSGTAGLLYIMFLAGLEMDLNDFKRNAFLSTVFGLYTFTFPMVLGFVVSYYIFGYTLITSILFASMLASHTLLTYPIVSKLGVVKDKSVSIAVGGTIITDTLALLILAVIVGMTEGEVNQEFWIKLGASILGFALFVMLVFPRLTRWFFKWCTDGISQYIFILVLLFLSAFLAHLAGLEGIIGAFLVGMVLNRSIPKTSPLMNRVEFVGNSIFIPFFLISVGMLVDYRSFFTSFNTLFVSAVMIASAVGAKYIAAWMTQKTFRLSVDQRRVLFGLSNSQAAATLAVVIVGFYIRLFNEAVLNGSILTILVSCTISSFVTQKGAYNLSVAKMSGEESADEKEEAGYILVPISNEETAEELVNLSLALRSKKKGDMLCALNVMENYTNDREKLKRAEKVLEIASDTSVAAGVRMRQVLRYDRNIVDAIFSVTRELNVTNLVLGLHKEKGIPTSFLGNITEGVLSECNLGTFIYKPIQPLATIRRHLIVIPEKSEKEIGFAQYIIRIWNVIQNTGARACFYCSANTMTEIGQLLGKSAKSAGHIEFSNWDDFLILTRELKEDDNLWVVLSRSNHLSFQMMMLRIPDYLNKYFSANSFILVYPVQANDSLYMT